jgi:hypothetical protein
MCIYTTEAIYAPFSPSSVSYVVFETHAVHIYGLIRIHPGEDM